MAKARVEDGTVGFAASETVQQDTKTLFSLKAPVSYKTRTEENHN